MGKSTSQGSAAGLDLDGDGIESHLDDAEGELGINRLKMSMKKSKSKRRNSKVRVFIDGWLDAGILGPEGSLERSDFSLNITGSEGTALHKSMPGGSCRMSKRGKLKCSARGAKLKVEKIRGLSDSLRRYRVQATVDIRAESMPAHPLTISASFGETDWQGSISSVTCEEKERPRYHKVKCEAAIGMEKVPGVMRPILVLRGTDMETREVELYAGKTTLGGLPSYNDITVLRWGVPALSKEIEVYQDAVRIRHIDGANSDEEIEAVPMLAGSPMSLSETDDVSATLIYRSIISDATDIVDHDSNRVFDGGQRAPARRVPHVANPWEKIIAFGDSITAGYTYFPSGEMMPGNYAALAVCSPPTGWPNTQCSNNQPGVYSKDQLLAHIDEHKGSKWGFITGVFDWDGDYFTESYVDHATASQRQSKHGSVGVMKRNMTNPTIAWPYQMQALLRANAKTIPVFNYAMSGATPANWDPTCNGQNWVKKSTTTGTTTTYHWELSGSCSLSANGNNYAAGGLYAVGCDMTGKSGKDKKGDHVNVCGPVTDSPDDPETRHSNWEPQWKVADEYQNQKEILFIGTLGANPLLRRWLHIQEGTENKSGANVKTSDCMETRSKAAKCMNADLKTYDHEAHIANALDFLLQRGDVVIMKYYHACPGLFGYNAIMGTVTTNTGSCSAYEEDVAFSLTDSINETIHRAVVTARGSANPLEAAASGYKIIEVCPGNMRMDATGACLGGFWDEHGAWKGHNPGGWGTVASWIGLGSGAAQGLNKNTWTTWNDSGMHPNPTGHQILAQSAVKGICRQMGRYCEVERGHPPAATEAGISTAAIANYTGAVVWAYGDDDQRCVGSTECAYSSIMNDTDVPLILKKSYYAHNPAYGFQSTDNVGRDAGMGKFVQFPVKRIEPKRTANMWAQNHDNKAEVGPTVQLEFKAGGGYLVFNVDSSATGGGTVAAYSSSPMYKVESLGDTDKHERGIVGNWRVSPRSTKQTVRFNEAQWPLNPDFDQNRDTCSAAMQDAGSKYAAYYSISNKGPDTLHLDDKATSLDHGAWCVKPAETIPAGHSTIAVIGDSGTALVGVAGTIKYKWGANKEHHIQTEISSLDSRQGVAHTSASSGAGVGHYSVKVANVCTFGVISEAVSKCVDTSTTVANIWVDTDRSVYAQGTDLWPTGGAIPVGEVCGWAGGDDSGVTPNADGLFEFPHSRCGDANANCGRSDTTMGPNSMQEYRTHTNECALLDEDDSFQKYRCTCECKEGMTLVGGVCAYPDCELPCVDAPASSWGAHDTLAERLKAAESAPAVCYRNTVADRGQCWNPIILSEGTHACYAGESPRDTLCKAISMTSE